MRCLVPLLMEKFETGEKAVSNLEILSGKMLREEILKYYYYHNAKLKGVATMKKADMVTKHLVLREQHALPSSDGSVVVGAGAGDENGH